MNFKYSVKNKDIEALREIAKLKKQLKENQKKENRLFPC